MQETQEELQFICGRHVKDRCTGSDLLMAGFPRPVYCSAEVNSGERKEEEANNELTHSLFRL